MVALGKAYHIFDYKSNALWIDAEKQVLVYERGGLVFAFNFSPNMSQENYTIHMPQAGKYQVVLSTDEKQFGGWDRISKTYLYETKQEGGANTISVYLPPRTALCLGIQK